MHKVSNLLTSASPPAGIGKRVRTVVDKRKLSHELECLHELKGTDLMHGPMVLVEKKKSFPLTKLMMMMKIVC